MEKFGDNEDREIQFRKSLEPKLRCGVLKKLVFQGGFAKREAILVLLEIPE